MTMLITGGTGKTGIALAKQVHEANIPFLIASRSGKAPEPFKGVQFDWLNPATFENPFTTDPNIDRVYIVAALIADQIDFARAFIDLAKSKGVKRFVLLSGSHLKAGDNAMGQIHQYLIDVGVEYAVMRPTWFQQNLESGFLNSILEHNQTFSAAGNGRTPFVSTEDIADAAFEALTVDRIVKNNLLIFGPELYSHDEVAKLLSTAVGREITHKRNTAEEMKNLYVRFGIREDYADMLSNMEYQISKGVEEELFNSDNVKFIGKRKLKDYVLSNREIWVKK